MLLCTVACKSHVQTTVQQCWCPHIRTTIHRACAHGTEFSAPYHNNINSQAQSSHRLTMKNSGPYSTLPRLRMPAVSTKR